MNAVLDDFVDILSTSPERFYDKNQYNLFSPIKLLTAYEFCLALASRRFFIQAYLERDMIWQRPKKKLSPRSTWFESEIVGEIR